MSDLVTQRPPTSADMSNLFIQHAQFDQTSPMATPAAVNPTLSPDAFAQGTPMTEKTCNLLEWAYKQGAAAAGAQFKPVAPPQPKATAPATTQPQTAAKPAAVKPTAPVQQMGPPPGVSQNTSGVPGIPAASVPPPKPIPNPMGQLSQMAPAQIAATTPSPVPPTAKLSEFRLRPAARLAPGEIAPDNGVSIGSVVRTPLDIDPAVKDGFDALRVPKNTDVMNAGNEALLGSPGI